MKFLDNIIEKIVIKNISSISIDIQSINSNLIALTEKQINNKEFLSSELLKIRTGLEIIIDNSLNAKLSDIKLEIEKLNQQLLESKKLISTNKEDLEVALDEIIKMFETKLEVLGYKKIITTDLLKKLAKLEGKDVSG